MTIVRDFFYNVNTSITSAAKLATVGASSTIITAHIACQKNVCIITTTTLTLSFIILQCFDTAGWVRGRASDL